MKGKDLRDPFLQEDRGTQRRSCLWLMRDGESTALRRSGAAHAQLTSDADNSHPRICHRPAPYCRYKAEGYWGEKLATGTDKNREMPKSILEEWKRYAKHNPWKCWRENGAERTQYACKQLWPLRKPPQSLKGWSTSVETRDATWVWGVPHSTLATLLIW